MPLRKEAVMRHLVPLYICCLLFSVFLSGCVRDVPARPENSIGIANVRFLDNDVDIDLYCLLVSYPQIERISRTEKLIELKNGQIIPYDSSPATGTAPSVRQSMQVLYPLEPERPSVWAASSPGRQRPYELLDALYGNNERNARSNLRPVAYGGRIIYLAQPAAEAFDTAVPVLNALSSESMEYARLLVPDGGFCWRRIAGEQAMSAHSYGIAIDLGAKYAPYWRWSRVMPHPMQMSYPEGVVLALEEHGFIWGGKWREYDLMHFEYRPELICKAKMIRIINKKRVIIK